MIVSKTTERLVAVTNELTDIVAQFEETQRPRAEWQDGAWNELMNNIQNEGLNLWEFDGDSQPVAILHEIYMAYKDTCEANDDLQDRLAQLRQPVVNTHLQEEHLRGLIRQADRIDWHTLRPVPAPEEVWPALGATEGTTGVEGMIRGPDVT